MAFTVRKINFGGAATGDDEDEGSDLPKPHLLRLQRRRAAGIREAKDVLAILPAPGESLHCVISARLDMTDILNALFEKLGRCQRATIATLGYNRRNFKTMLAWLDSGTVGTLSVIASRFFLAHNAEMWQETVDEFRKRGQRCCCCYSHCKVMALEFASGAKMVVEGSANLCSNGSAKEQFCLVNDPELCAWHSSWIEAILVKHEGKPAAPQQGTGSGPR
jgi:hypothetical protein